MSVRSKNITNKAVNACGKVVGRFSLCRTGVLREAALSSAVVANALSSGQTVDVTRMTKMILVFVDVTMVIKLSSLVELLIMNS